MKSTILKPILFSLALVQPIFSTGASISMAAQRESVGEYVDDGQNYRVGKSQTDR